MFRTIFFSLIICSVAFSQYISDAVRLAAPGFSTNARAMGMGNAFTGLSDDASAMFFNPAGLGLIRKLEIAGGMDYVKYSNTSSFFGNETSANNSKTSLNQAAFVFPFPTVQGSLVFGMSYNQTKQFYESVKFAGQNNTNTSMIQDMAASTSADDQDIPYLLGLCDDAQKTPIRGGLYQDGSYLSSGSLNSWSFAGAVEVDKNLFIGANISILSGTFTKDKDYWETDVLKLYDSTPISSSVSASKIFRDFNFKTSIEWDLSGFDAKIGVLYQLKKYGRFGVTFQLPKSYTIKETYTVNASSSFKNGVYRSIKPEEFSDKVEYDFSTPFSFTIGGSGHVQGLTLAADLTFIDYSQAEFSSSNDVSRDLITSTNKSIKDNLTAVANYNVGAEYTVPEVDMRIRAGYFTQKSPYTNNMLDRDKQYYTLGLGFLVGTTTTVDVAYLHGWWNEYVSNYGYLEDSFLSQKVKINNFSMSIHYRF